MTTPLEPDDDRVDIIEDEEVGIIEDDGVVSPATSAAAGDRQWEVLVVDDDDEVHHSTAYSLRGVDLLGRRLSLIHARSSAEAVEALRTHPGIAVILLDVVMETDDAGLRMVRTVREDLALSAVRIILRTGQPGYAPELAVIRDYDINDYRTKSELTRTRLLASLYSALRTHGHLLALETHRRGLEQIIKASAELFRRNSLPAFCEGILIQLGALLDMDTGGIVLARDGGDRSQGPVVLAASGSFRHLSGQALDHITEEDVRTLLLRVLEQRITIYDDRATGLHIAGPSGDDLAVYLANSRGIEPLDRTLLEVFSSNVALGYDNAALLDRVRSLAYYDPLTRLPNRALLRERTEARLARLEGDEKLALFTLDLDHFQAVSDGLGQEAGDQMLRLIAARLTDYFAADGAVGRLSGDMFGVLTPLHHAGDEAAAIALINGGFEVALELGGAPLMARMSGGYAVAGAGDADVPRLMRHAGMAMKLAKKSGRGRVLRFEPEMEEELHSRLALIGRIAEAQARGQFSLVYQPQIRLRDDAVVGVEALLRWRCPDGSWIRPDAFIPAAEDAGQIVSLGEWVLREACQRQVAWRRGGVAPLRMAVNVSVRQIRDGDFPAVAERALRETGAHPAEIELEITESHAMEDSKVLSTAETLRAMGFRIAIDDFGTGYSSLARLRQLPASLLKIDRAFVRGMDHATDSRSIASMIVKMGHELGLDVLAEGVETLEEEAVLRELECDEVQGFLHSKPLPPAELETWLCNRTAAA
ncbi:transcriptional regulator [Skermanella stibiiresistens SB22]|uniref:Transcriptional regulator n=1 Tax=Skermanella stibiiresistens SB22 TaxID=1385369 RepID=W9H1Q6_9PROT|nr:EAL domain-containing protein [Skermanella stibiiresistens]EWY37678.1 transcriptional regulator [Skermanella stibiiresistens SB22]